MMKISSYFKKFGFLIGVTLVLVGIIPILSLIFMSTYNLKNNFEIIEKETLTSDILQLQNIFDSELDSINQIVVDYSIWDDTYNAIINKDEEFYNENFDDWLPVNFGIDLIIVSDLNNNTLGTYNVEDKYVNEWVNELNVINGIEDEFILRRGIKKFNNSIFLFAYSPILKSDYSGQTNGYVVIAKKINKDFLVKINKKFGYDLFVYYDNQAISNFDFDDFYKSEISSDLNGDDIIFTMYDDFTFAKTSIKNINEDDIAILGIKKSRVIYDEVLGLIYKNGSTSIFIAIILDIFLGIFLTRLIVSPLLNFEKEITDMTKKQKIKNIKPSGILEFKKLAEVFNLMADKLFDEKNENKILKESNNRDGLTDLYNHRYYHEYVENLISNKTKKIGLLFCDIDRFKTVNDTFGHTAGDKVLIDIAKAITHIVPKTSEVFRYGGEEFVVVLVDVNDEEVLKIGEEIRNFIDFKIQINEDYHYMPLTMSIGLAMYPDDTITIQDLIDKADSAMYYAKQTGRNQCHRYTEDMEEFLLHNSEIIARKEVLFNSAFALAAAIDVKDVYTGKHSEFVTKYALLLGDKLGISPKDKQLLRIGALLHDCGKIGIPDDIINKPTKLTEPEYEIIKNHTVFGYNIVRHISKTPSIMSCVRNHHERWDGMGYPDGLKGEKIPLLARVVCVADTFHAMISDRPYRKALTIEVAFSELRHNAGTQFDPNLIEVFIEAIQKSDMTTQQIQKMEYVPVSRIPTSCRKS